MPFLNWVDRRILWLTVSKAADLSSKTRNEDLEAVLASLRSSTTERQGSFGRMPTSEARLFAVQEVVLFEKCRDLV